MTHLVLPVALGFRAGWWLLALLLVPVAVAAYVAFQGRRRKDALRFSSLATLASVMPNRPGWRRHVAPAILLLALVSLVVALAKPEHDVSVPREEASIMLVTDTSGSMAADDVAPNRLAAAQSAASSFLGRVPDRIRVGLASFSSTASVLQTPTVDREAVRESLSLLQPNGNTATGDGINVALDVLERANQGRSEKERVPGAIVLLSDGKAQRGADPLQAAQRANGDKIPIYTVALGTPEGVLSDPATGQVVPVPPDPEALQAIASASGGKFFDAPSADSLQDAYKDLGSRLGTDKESREITATFAGIGLLLLLVGAGAGLVLTGRLP